MSNKNKDLPILEGYMKKPNGDLVAIENIAEVKLLKDETVKRMIESAKNMKSQMTEFKQKIWDEFYAFVDLSYQEHGVKRGGSKGNITLTSFDGSLKVQLSVAEKTSFDEQMQVAKDLIDEYLIDIVQDVDPAIKTIVMSAFDVNKEGLISASKMLSLRHYKFDDDRWRKAMEIIAESMVVTGTKNYIRFFENGQNITLDISKL